MKMEESKNQIGDNNIKSIGNEKEKKISPGFQMNTIGIDIVNAMVDDAVFSKTVQDDNESSNDIVQNIIEEVLVTNIIQDDRNLPGTQEESNNCTKNNTVITDENDTKSDLSNNKISNIDILNSTSNVAKTSIVNEQNISSNESIKKNSLAAEKLQQNSMSNEVPEVVDLSSEEDKDATGSTDEKNSDDETGRNQLMK